MELLEDTLRNSLVAHSGRPCSSAQPSCDWTPASTSSPCKRKASLSLSSMRTCYYQTEEGFAQDPNSSCCRRALWFANVEPCKRSALLMPFVYHRCFPSRHTVALVDKKTNARQVFTKAFETQLSLRIMFCKC